MKILCENELEQRAKKHRKTNKKHALGYFVKLNGGNPEYNAETFNHMMGSDGGSSEGACCENLEESNQKNSYEILYITRDTDRTARGWIDAYSEKQAALLFKKSNKNVYRIVSINCVEDHSKDDGEQLSLFETTNKTFKKRLVAVNPNLNLAAGSVVHHLKYNTSYLDDVLVIDASKVNGSNKFIANIIHQLIHICYNSNITWEEMLERIKIYHYTESGLENLTMSDAVKITETVKNIPDDL